MEYVWPFRCQRANNTSVTMTHAASKKAALWMRYFTASRGTISERHASIKERSKSLT